MNSVPKYVASRTLKEPLAWNATLIKDQAMEPAHVLAELGYWMGIPVWDRGYTTEAARALLQSGFLHLSLNRVQASLLVRNPASGRVMRKLGMSYEGVPRQRILKWGRFGNVVVYVVLPAEWRVRASAWS